MIYRINIFLLSFFIAFAPILAYAGEDPYALHKSITQGMNKTNSAKVVFGQGWRVKMENAWHPGVDNKDQLRKMVERSVAVEKPTAARVGGSMLKRLYSPQALVGTAAVSGLLAAIGWVMEDGVYVKKIKEDLGPEDPSKYQYRWRWDYNLPQFDCYTASSCVAQGNALQDYSIKNLGVPEGNRIVYDNCKLSGTNMFCTGKLKQGGSYRDYTMARFSNDKYDPKPPNTKTVPLTAALLGAAMLGDGYQDPDPNFDNDKVNVGDWTGVTDAYTEDPSGIGNDNSDRMNDKLKNAKPTDDGKPAPIGDPRYDDDPKYDDDTGNDRKWDESGDEATGETKPTVDPETGEQTGGQSISLQFPVFCTWASSMCKWYDDWTKSDKTYKDHLEKEKTFWEKVTDFFDWFKDDELPEKDKDDQDQEDLITLQKVDISWGAQCPTPEKFTFELAGESVEISILNFDYICPYAPIIKPVVIFGASLEALFILSGIRRNGGDDE